MIYLFCIISYLILLAGIAIWKTRDVKDQSDFAVAGRTLSPWIMVCTMLAVWIGTGSIVGNAEQTYESGMAAMLLPIGTLVGMALLSLIATRARNIEASTVPEIIGLRFGSVARNLAMFSLVIAYMVIVSYQFNAGGAVLEVIVGEKAPVDVAQGEKLSSRQLTSGQLAFVPETDWTGNQEFTIQQSDTGGADEILIHLKVAPPAELQEWTMEEADETWITTAINRPVRIRFPAELLRDESYVVSRIPSFGKIQLVEPILTARTATIIAAAFIISYAALAGLMSLAWMDMVTGSIIMLTMVISFPIYWFKAGGWSGIESGFLADNRASHLQLWGVYSPTQLVDYTLPVFLLVLGDANQYQRIFASRTAKGARTAVVLMVFIAFVIELLIIGCAWLASSMTPDPENGKYILIYAARHYLALPLGCLFMVTVVAIIISTADSFLHVPATSAVNDVYLNYINPQASQRHILFVSRAMVIVFGIIAYIVTLLFAETTGFFEKALYAFTIYGASITPSLVAALTWKRATRPGAIASICSGAIVTLLWSELESARAALPSAIADLDQQLPAALRSAALGLAELTANLDAVLPAIVVSVTLLVTVSWWTNPRPVHGDNSKS